MIEDIRRVFTQYGIKIDPIVISTHTDSLVAIWKLCRDAELRRQTEEKCEFLRTDWLLEKSRADEYHQILDEHHLLPGQQEHIAAASRACSCCSVCCDHPCAPTLAGGFCDLMECRCSEEISDDVPF